MKHSELLRRAVRLLVIPCMFLTSGCLATQDWVQSWTNEQLFPMNKRISDTETNVTQIGGKVANVDARVDGMAKQITELENRLSQTNAKADRALESLQRLKPERKMVLNFTEGAHFASNSIQFSGQAKKDIDSFLSDLKGSSDDGGNLVFVVAGHSDSAGSASYNYELSKRRAENIAAYLVAERNIDPTHLIAVGYGERAPVADNKTAAGRAKNRRVEIMVYRDSIGVGTTAAGSGPTAKTR